MLSSVFFRAMLVWSGLVCLACMPHALALPALAENEQLLHVDSGETISPSDLLQALNQADVSAWGEVHDNPRHHALRAELLRAIKARRVTIVAEHMDAGKQVDPRLALPDALGQAGFDAPAWQWPLHQVLFEAVQQAGLAFMAAISRHRKPVRCTKAKEAAHPLNCNTCCATRRCRRRA